GGAASPPEVGWGGEMGKRDRPSSDGLPLFKGRKPKSATQKMSFSKKTKNPLTQVILTIGDKRKITDKPGKSRTSKTKEKTKVKRIDKG
ncbi:hypothetical protein, partial [Streptococcus suis]